MKPAEHNMRYAIRRACRAASRNSNIYAADLWLWEFYYREKGGGRMGREKIVLDKKRGSQGLGTRGKLDTVE